MTTPRFDDGDAVDLVYLQYPVHTLKREDDAASERNRTSVKTAARAARRYGDMFTAGDLHDRRYLRGIRRFDDRLRHVSPDAPSLVPGVVVEALGVVHDDASGADGREQLLIYFLSYCAVLLHQ